MLSVWTYQQAEEKTRPLCFFLIRYLHRLSGFFVLRFGWGDVGLGWTEC